MVRPASPHPGATAHQPGGPVLSLFTLLYTSPWLLAIGYWLFKQFKSVS
jgi:hypothetical protein